MTHDVVTPSQQGVGTPAPVDDRARAEQHLRVQYAVMRALVQAKDFREAAPGVLGGIGETLGWRFGAIWAPDDDGVLRCVDTWQAPGASYPTFERATRERTFEKGFGLPGRMLVHARPVWLEDVVIDDNFPRGAAALSDGLHAGFAFPAVLRGDVLAVIEFYNDAIQKPDEDLLALAEATGGEVALFIERTRAETALRESERRYRTLADALPAIVCVGRLDGTVEYYNERWYDYTGLDQDDSRVGGWRHVMHPDDYVVVVELWRICRENQQPFEQEARIRRADGVYRWHLGRTTPLHGPDGSIEAWLITSVDIDEIKRAQESLREESAVVETLQAVGASLTSQLDMTAVAEAVTNAATALSGADFGSFVFAGDDDAMESYAGNGRGYVDLRELRDRAKDRGITRIDDLRDRGIDAQVRSFMAVPVRSHAGGLHGELLFGAPAPGFFGEREERIVVGIASWAAVAMDNARLFEEAARAAEDLRRANAAKDEFLGLVSHELRTPITTIYGNAQVLRNRGDALREADRIAAMEDMEHEAERLQRIIDNLLVLARFEAGKELPTEPLLVKRAILNVIASYRRRMGGREIALAVADDLVPVASEETYFEQVLHNLIGNAAKYSPPGAPIEVRAERAGDEVVVRVLDRGAGISEEDASQIFEPFFRSRRTAGQAGGAGLGLAVCKRLIEAQGGRIWARPREGGGSEFGFALPAFPDFT